MHGCDARNDISQSELHLTDINVEPRMDENGEMRILGIEATLQVRLIVYEEEKIQILEDLYMLDHICIPEVKERGSSIKTPESFQMQDQ